MPCVGVKRFTDLRAWQACMTYKRAIYRLCDNASWARDWKRRGQLEDSVRALIDALDKRYITEESRLELNALAEAALEEVTGLMEYLQSPGALRNARRARQRRMATRAERRTRT
jgi:hypothetical protein